MTSTEQHGCPHLAQEDHPIHTFGDDFTQDPFPTLDALREQGSVHRVRLPNGQERWLVTRYDAVLDALGDLRLSNELGRSLPQQPPSEPLAPGLQVGVRVGRLLGQAMANVDPPKHDRLRKLIVRHFSVKQVDRMRPRVQQITDELFDAVAGLPQFDLIAAVSHHLPITMICELLGVPDHDEEVFRTAATVLGGFQSDEEAALRTVAALDTFEAYLRNFVATLRVTPGSDLLSNLMQKTEADEEPMTDDELVSMAALLLFGGYEPSAQLIGNALLALLRHPDQLDTLRSDPALLPAAVEEAIRYDGPLLGLPRYALEDVEIDGTVIPQGSLVILSSVAANRDPSRWDEPHRFDITRPSTARQLGFGHGLHYCVGARLAALEVEVVLGTALRRFPRLRLAVPAERLVRRPGQVRGVVELPLLVD